MYNLDINFLNDRPEYQNRRRTTTLTDGAGGVASLVVGGVAAALPLLLVLGGWGYLTFFKNPQLQKEHAELEQQLKDVRAQVQTINDLRTQAEQIQSEVQVLSTAFSQLKSWSSVLRDVRDLTPDTVQIRKITQIADKNKSTPRRTPAPADPAAATPEDPPLPTITLEIEGFAQSFEDVGAFVVTLKESPFLASEKVKLVSSELQDNRTNVEVERSPNQQGSGGELTVEIPQVVEYKIEAQLAELSTKELLPALESKGADGVVARIQAIQQQGILQP